MEMEPIDLKTIPLLKIKFDELPTSQNASDIINFWRSLPVKIFRISENMPKVFYAVLERLTDANRHFLP